ncbi:MAG: hypothetical protein IRZ04_03755 [Rhodospirillales bacterium]|nr:hypothetical protein [Rhodospirillales bacterium]
MWSTWLQRTLNARNAHDYKVRRDERDRAYALLRHQDAVAARDAAAEESDKPELVGAA